MCSSCVRVLCDGGGGGGRWEEQRYRLRLCGLSHVGHIVEGELGRSSLELRNAAAIETAVMRCRVCDRTHVHATRSVDESIAFVRRVHAHVTAAFGSESGAVHCAPGEFASARAHHVALRARGRPRARPTHAHPNARVRRAASDEADLVGRPAVPPGALVPYRAFVAASRIERELPAFLIFGRQLRQACRGRGAGGTARRMTRRGLGGEADIPVRHSERTMHPPRVSNGGEVCVCGGGVRACCACLCVRHHA